MTVRKRNEIIRTVAERHCEGIAYQSDRYRRQLAYWLRQVRRVAGC